jgi:3-isopropylmalate/(R)-2-methylmalate dehydratase small subunit
MAQIILEKVIKEIIGRGVPKPEDNQNTDDMVYGGELNRITFKGYGKDLFAVERKDNPHHPLNDLRYAGATILIGGENYGCGSSREHAPQAHLDFGLRALVTAGYAGIFQGNCASIGLVAVTVPKSDIVTLSEMVRKYPHTRLTIDLEDKNLGYHSQEGPTGIMPFEIPENVRQSFLNGTWDALALLRSNPEKVAETMKRVPYFEFR